MAKMVCPSCGADVPVRSAAMPYAVCSYCQTLIARKGEELEAIGKASVLPFDVSPIQLGTAGEAFGKSFEIIGRIRWRWEGGSWNEWLMNMADGSHCWLSDVSGMYMVTQMRPDVLYIGLARDFAEGKDLRRGAQVEVDGIVYQAGDIKTAECIGAEGDLPFPAEEETTLTNIDFFASDGSALCLQRYEDEAEAWLGRYCVLADLEPRNLRRMEGWTMPAQFA